MHEKSKPPQTRKLPQNFCRIVDLAEKGSYKKEMVVCAYKNAGVAEECWGRGQQVNKVRNTTFIHSELKIEKIKRTLKVYSTI